MSYIQGADREQIVFLPDILDDYVGEETEVRVIDAFIKSGTGLPLHSSLQKG